MEWISVEKELPRALKKVMVGNRQTVAIAYRTANKKSFDWIFEKNTLIHHSASRHVFTHWMPLPEPPKIV